MWSAAKGLGFAAGLVALTIHLGLALGLLAVVGATDLAVDALHRAGQKDREGG